MTKTKMKQPIGSLPSGLFIETQEPNVSDTSFRPWIDARTGRVAEREESAEARERLETEKRKAACSCLAAGSS
ncbi:hypothetical protein AAFX91_14650 [Bradyrhizobium sp. 31Argb]|uniref:hypothetical protein n=1 Tax=Bradyrhizobium sp. 31Argb TaxID=3141247 RepID=UPI003749DD06